MPVTKTVDRTADVQKAVDALIHKRLLVGIVQPTDTRAGEPIGNAALGYIHEVGSPKMNIPARPWLRPGVEAARPKIVKAFGLAGRAALTGDISAIDTYFEAAGQAGRDACKAHILSNVNQPIKPESLLKRKRGRAARQRRAIKAAGGMKAWRKLTGRQQQQAMLRMAETLIASGGVVALVDTAQLINSITYAVRSK